MESTTRVKPKIFSTGAPTAQDINALADLGDVFSTNTGDGMEHADILWVDCATTRPDAYEPVLQKVLNSGKTLIMTQLDSQAHTALEKVVGARYDEGVTALMVSRDMRATTPSSHAATVLEAAPSHWAKTFEAHQARQGFAVGGPGLIPPQGVLYGIRDLSNRVSTPITATPWTDIPGRPQTVELSFSSSFYVYRENGRSAADYVVIRVQQATSSPGTLMVNTDNAKGYWQYEVQLGCAVNRDVALLSTGPDTTTSSNLVTQLTIPLRVKSIQDGSCHAHFWPAIHGPVARATEGWQVSQHSVLSEGHARWRHFHLTPWNVFDDPVSEFSRWFDLMYEGTPRRVKSLSPLSASTVTLENCAAWRFTAKDIAYSPEVKFTESGYQRVAAFATPQSASPSKHRIDDKQVNLFTRTLTLNLPQVADDVASPCR